MLALSRWSVFVMGLAVCAITMCLILSYQRNMETGPLKRIFKNNYRQPFVYLTQTKQCLPPNLASSAQIGDGSSCNCDVIVLSYGQECKEHRSPHITYLFHPQSTWPEGRNALFNAARKRTPQYHYYIVMDDDVILGYNEFTPPEMKLLQPFRVVENWLLDYEPAVGVFDYKDHGVKYVFEIRQKVCGIQEHSLVIPTVMFHAPFNAFHKNTVEHILPYSTRYDQISWLAANKRIRIIAELKFRGQTLLFVPVTVVNVEHRQDPVHRTKPDQKILTYFIDELQQQAPPIYRNQELFEIYKRDSYRHWDKSWTYCMEVKKHQPIVPYAHFNRPQPEKKSGATETHR